MASAFLPFLHQAKKMRTTLSLNQIIEEWIASLDGLPSTQTDYRRKIRLWFRWLVAQGKDPREPRRDDVLAFRQQLLYEGKSRYTYFSYITVVRLFYRYCARRHYCEDIGEGIRSSIRSREHYKYPLSAFQAQQLLESISTESIVGKRDKLIVALMLLNGLRSCEVCRINIEDVVRDGDRTLLRIQRKGHLDKHDVVALPEFTATLYEEYLAERDFRWGDALIVNHCKGRSSTRLTTQSISHLVKQRLRAIGINDPKITAHSLRHTCGSLLVESGMDIELIRDLLGHTSSATTRIYIDMAQKRRLLDQNPSRIIEAMVTKTPGTLKS